MPVIDRFAAELRRRIFLGELLRLAAFPLALVLMAFGAVVLAVKLFLPDLWPHILWLAAGLPLLGLPLARRAWRRTPAPVVLVGRLDDRLGTGGLMMTLWERPDRRWKMAMPDEARCRAALPAIVPEPFVRALVVPTMFLAGALALPPADAVPAPPPGALADSLTNELNSAMAIMQGSEFLDAQTTAGLAREVGRLATAIENQPLTDQSWATVDALRNRMQTTLATADVTLHRSERVMDVLRQQLTRNPSASGQEGASLGKSVTDALKILRETGTLAAAAKGADTATPPPGAALAQWRQFVANPATRELAVSMLRGALTRQRHNLDQTRNQLARVFGTPPTSRAVNENSPPPQTGDDNWDPQLPVVSVPSMGDGAITSAASFAGDFGQDFLGHAASLRQSLLPLEAFVPSALTRDSSPPSQLASRKRQRPVVSPRPRQQPASKNAVSQARRPTNEQSPVRVSSDVFEKSPTWQRRLRPRHRRAVRAYFHGG